MMVIFQQFAENSLMCHCERERSNPIHNRIKHFEIAASLTLLAMTTRIEFFHRLLIL